MYAFDCMLLFFSRTGWLEKACVSGYIYKINTQYAHYGRMTLVKKKERCTRNSDNKFTFSLAIIEWIITTPMLPAAQHIYSNSFLSFPFFFWQEKWWRITFRSTPDTLLAGAMPAKSCFILCFCSNSPALFFSTHILTKLGNCDQEPRGSEQRNNVEGAAKEGF